MKHFLLSILFVIGASASTLSAFYGTSKQESPPIERIMQQFAVSEVTYFDLANNDFNTNRVVFAVLSRKCEIAPVQNLGQSYPVVAVRDSAPRSNC